MAEFLGEYRHSVDSKGRVAVPNSFRKRLSSDCEGKFILQRGRGGTIEVHPLPHWREFVNRTLRRLPTYQPKAQRLRRYRLASAVEVSLDSQGRILIPRCMLDEAGITTEAVLTGAGEVFEIWEPGHYGEFRREAGQHYDDDLTELEQQDWKGTESSETAMRHLPPASDGQ